MFSVLEKQHEGGMAGGISEVRVVGDEVEEVLQGSGLEMRGELASPWISGSDWSHFCFNNLYAENIMRNARLDEAQAGIKMAGRNTNNLRYADDSTLMAESEEEISSLLMKVKVESEKVGLKLSIQKTKIMASGPIKIGRASCRERV